MRSRQSSDEGKGDALRDSIFHSSVIGSLHGPALDCSSMMWSIAKNAKS